MRLDAGVRSGPAHDPAAALPPAPGAAPPAGPSARRSLAGYLVVGGLSFGVDLGLLVTLHGVFGVRLLVASGVAFWCGLAVNFLLNRGVVFPGGSAGTRTQLLRYLALVAVNFAVTLAVIAALTGLGVAYPLAKAAATGLLVALNYAAYRWWVFC